MLGELLPPATELGQGNFFRSVCQEFCPGGGRVWQGNVRGGGACMADTTRYGQ